MVLLFAFLFSVGPTLGHVGPSWAKSGQIWAKLGFITEHRGLFGVSSRGPSRTFGDFITDRVGPSWAKLGPSPKVRLSITRLRNLKKKPKWSWAKFGPTWPNSVRDDIPKSPWWSPWWNPKKSVMLRNDHEQVRDGQSFVSRFILLFSFSKTSSRTLFVYNMCLIRFCNFAFIFYFKIVSAYTCCLLNSLTFFIVLVLKKCFN